jgi:RNA binding exosome subunit
LKTPYEEIQRHSNRSEHHHEKEPDDFVRAVPELTRDDIDDRYEPEEKESDGHYGDRSAVARTGFNELRIEKGSHAIHRSSRNERRWFLTRIFIMPVLHYYHCK